MRAFALVPLLALAGCAGLKGLDASRMDAEARADDARCAQGGVSFPSEAYDHCRRHLMDERIDDQRHEVALNSQQSPYAILTTPPEPEGVHRTIDPERFRCAARGEGASRVIICEEE